MTAVMNGAAGHGVLGRVAARVIAGVAGRVVCRMMPVTGQAELCTVVGHDAIQRLADRHVLDVQLLPPFRCAGMVRHGLRVRAHAAHIRTRHHGHGVPVSAGCGGTAML